MHHTPESFGSMSLNDVFKTVKDLCLAVPSHVTTPSGTDSAQNNKSTLPFLNMPVVFHQFINNSTIQSTQGAIVTPAKETVNTTSSRSDLPSTSRSNPTIVYVRPPKPPPKPSKDEKMDRLKFDVIMTRFKITSNPNDKVILSDIRMQLKKQHHVRNGNITPRKVIQLLNKYSDNYPKTAMIEHYRHNNRRIYHIPYLKKL